jgi:DNA-binding transcriptional ArsR family regulator
MTAPAWQPARSRVVDTADAIKAMADPLRLQLLQLLMRTWGRSWSVKEMAAELHQPVTKLYHHVKLLEGADLITDVDTRLVSGIVEHRYRTAQRSLKFDESLFLAPETRDDSIAQVAALVDTSRDALLDYLHLDPRETDQVLISRNTAKLTAEEIKAVMTTIEQLVETFARASDEERSSGPRTAMLCLLHPLVEDDAELPAAPA